MFRDVLRYSLVCILFGAIPVVAQPVKLRFASFESPTAPITSRALIPWANEVSAASGGTLEVEMFAGGTLGRDPAQQVRMVQDGVAHIAWTAPAFTPGRFGGFEVVELPFMLRNAREGSLALWRIYERGLLSGFDKFKLLLIGTNSPMNISSRMPIETLAALKGKRIRTAGAVRVKVIERLGAVPTQIPVTTIAEALSKGVVDGTVGEWLFVETFKVADVAHHHLEVAISSTAVMVFMLKSNFDALPAVARAAIDRSSGEPFVRRLIEVFESTEGAFREQVTKDPRSRVVIPTETELITWRKLTEPVTDGWRKESELNERVYQTFDAELKKVRRAQ